MSKNKHLGSSFDDFLREEGIFEEVALRAAKKLVAFQLLNEMKRKKISKAGMARTMKTSRAALDRILDPKNRGTTIDTLERAAVAVGRRVKIELV
jgi:antitoxin HicB